MASRREQRAASRAYHKAQRKAKKIGGSVCGTYRDGVPIYFVMPAEATDEQIEEAAFEAREGRPRLEGERVLARMAQPYMRSA